MNYALLPAAAFAVLAVAGIAYYAGFGRGFRSGWKACEDFTVWMLRRMKP